MDNIIELYTSGIITDDEMVERLIDGDFITLGQGLTALFQDDVVAAVRAAADVE